MANAWDEWRRNNPDYFVSDEDHALAQSNPLFANTMMSAKDMYHQGGDKDEAHRMAEDARGTYGNYSGGSWGNEYNQLGGTLEGQGGQGNQGFSYETAPVYASRYDKPMQELLGQIMGRDPFSYDPENDPTYQQYKQSYTRGGQRAMQDTLGQVSARTGGLASSYATSAGQQAYGGYMSALADKIPELRQLAYSMYRDEGADQRANMEMLRALEQGDYGKYRDLLSQYNTDRAFDYGVYSDDWNRDFAVEGRNWDRWEADEQKTYDRAWNEDERAYGREQDQWNKDVQRAGLLAAAGDYSGYASVFGLTPEQTKLLVDEFARVRKISEDQAAQELAAFYAQYGDFSKLGALGVNTSFIKAQQNAQMAGWNGGGGGGGSGGGSGGGGSGGGSSGYTEAEKQKAFTLFDSWVRQQAVGSGSVVGGFNLNDYILDWVNQQANPDAAYNVAEEWFKMHGYASK